MYDIYVFISELQKVIIYVAFLAMIRMIGHCSCMIYPLLTIKEETIYSLQVQTRSNICV
jgi:hypothetical protein